MDEALAEAVGRAALAFTEGLAREPEHDPRACGMVEDCISGLERAAGDELNLRGIDDELAKRSVELLSTCARHSPRQGLRLVSALWAYFSRAFFMDGLPQERQDGSSEARACAELYTLQEMLEGLGESHLPAPRPPEWASAVFTSKRALARADRSFAKLHAEGFVWAFDAYVPPVDVSFASARRLMDQGREFAELSAGEYGAGIAARTWADYRVLHDDPRILKSELPSTDKWGPHLEKSWRTASSTSPDGC
ncbi:hypothetical protein [Ornithinimicrobium avium]|uniref:Uncharacterized protein n=1 Tax=Ornithinimicrobium avium TaxID=2283195 RepID=A0A345NKE2_9MICO|nr:hypothetical protein [Ornithinimicrobium avium]AXH95500.1 hypothetical protein DV701_04570 [Ornithinimicrobium avium]